MGLAWDYSVKECSADGKFSAEFDGLYLVMGRRVLVSYGVLYVFGRFAVFGICRVDG